jgi:hypothetical protein
MSKKVTRPAAAKPASALPSRTSLPGIGAIERDTTRYGRLRKNELGVDCSPAIGSLDCAPAIANLDCAPAIANLDCSAALPTSTARPHCRPRLLGRIANLDCSAAIANLDGSPAVAKR